VSRNTVPWSRADAAWLVVLMAIGTIGGAYCSYRVGDEIAWEDQEPWLYGALLFAGIGLIGVVGWLTSGSRNIKAAERVLRHDYAEVFRGVVGREYNAPLRSETVAAVGVLVTAPGMRRYHRETCPVVAGKAVRTLRADDLTALEPCRMCAP
jgi:hypothetical protein